MSENAPDYRVYAGQRYEVGAAWSQVAKSSGETYLNLKIGAPEFGPNWVRARLVKLQHPNGAGATHIALWEPRDRYRPNHRRGPPRRGLCSARLLHSTIEIAGASL